MKGRRSIANTHIAQTLGGRDYEVIAHGRVNGDKVRVERWSDGQVRGWNATQGRAATQDEIDALLNR